MGVHLSVYVGPYILITPKIELQTRIIRACDTEDCTLRAYQSHDYGIKFCPQCGNVLKDIELKPIEKKISPYNLDEYDDISEIMVHPNNLDEYVFLPNYSCDDSTYVDGYGDGDSITPLTNVNAADVIARFKDNKMCREFIDWLIKYEFEFIVEYGIISYYS